MRTRSLALWTTLLAPLALPAQSTDSSRTVRVLVRHEGAPVAQAVVSTVPSALAPRPAGALTGDDGRATLQLRSGDHSLVAARIGFAPETLAVAVTLDGPDPELTFELEEAAEALEEILVSSTRTSRRVEDEPVRVEVLPREEIEEKLLMTPGDITMMLNETSGLRLQPTAPSLGGASVRVQGLRGRYTQVLFDGLPLHGGQTGSLGLLQIPPMDLGQVEIIKGAASALYGSSALGGVINLISRRPERARELLVNRGSRGVNDVVGYLADSIGGGWAWSALAGAHQQRVVDVDGDDWADIPGYERGVLRPRLFWSNASGASAFVTGGVTYENRRGGTMPDRFAPDGAPAVEGLRTRRYDGGTVLRLLRGNDLLALRGSLTVQRHRHRFDDVRERDRHETSFAEASWTRAGERHSTVVGVAFQRDDYEFEDPLSPSGFDFRVPGVFAQLDLEPASWLALSTSARLDWHGEYGRFLSPRLSALVRQGEWTVRASAGGGMAGPTPLTEEAEVVGFRRTDVFPPLERERAWSTALDVGRLVGPLELNATLFAARVDRPVVAYPQDVYFQVRNAPDPVRAQGGELLARYRRDALAVTGTYAYLDSSEPDTDPGRFSETRPSALVPRHTASIIAMLEEHDAGRAGLELYYTGSQPLDRNPYREESPAYLIVGLLVERRFGIARLFVNGENLLGVRQSKWDPLLLPERDSFGRWTTDAWAPLDGRTVNGGARFDF